MPTSTVLKKLSMAAAVATFFALGTVSTAQAVTLVVPGSLSSTEGNTNNASPFNFLGRNQQVFAASEFTSLSEPELITQISFRPDAVFGEAFSFTIPNIQINLSTISAAVDGLSATFLDNIGTDETVVFSGPLFLSSAFTGPATEPKDFDISINLQTPFLYNPTVGNLLLDVRNFSENFSVSVFDAQNVVGDSISRGWINDVNSPTSLGDGNPYSFSNSLGLVTQFTFVPVPVPEPSPALSLLAFGVLGGGILLKRKLKNIS